MRDRTLGELAGELPVGVQISVVRQDHLNVIPRDDLILRAGDSVMLVAEAQAAIAEAAKRLGQIAPGRIARDRSALNYIRVFVSKAALVGVPLFQLPLPAGIPMQLLHVRRYDMDIVAVDPHPAATASA